jgi:hypothetical protein
MKCRVVAEVSSEFLLYLWVFVLVGLVGYVESLPLCSDDGSF